MSEEVEERIDLASLIPDEYKPETPEPVAAEPEPEADEEVVDEVDESTELPAEETPTQSDPKPNSDLIDKQVQKLQQLNATYEREIAALQKNPTDKQVDRVEKAKSKLDKYIEQSDVDPYQGVSDIASEVMSDRGKVEQLLQQFEADRRMAAEREARREAEMAHMRFVVDFPELKGQYQTIQQEAHDAVVNKLGDAINTIDAASYVALASAEFAEIANRKAEASQAKTSKAATPKVKDTARKPKATNIVNSNKGNSEKPPPSLEAEERALLDRLKSGFRQS